MSGGPGRDTAYDGRWSSRMDSYILPPLIGLPFSEMVRNGEGERHKSDSKYRTLIIVHAVFMAIPFLFLIPTAIYFARYKKHQDPRKAIQWHFILNTTTVVFLTIGFLAGWFAVNKGEWGANPHHIIGATLYGGIILQVLFGIALRQTEKNKLRKLGQVGLRAMLHAWFGRGLSLLGLAQIPLGLYLYGAPLPLFIIYAVIVFLLFITWFISEYIHARRQSRYGLTRVGSVRGGQAGSEGPAASNGSGHRRGNSHSGVSYTEMTETTHPAPTTITPGTFVSRTSYDGEGTEYTSNAGTRLPDNAQLMPMNSPSPRVGRLNRLSQSLGNKWKRGVSSLEGRIIGGGGTEYSYDASTRPPTGSTNRFSGLHAPPSHSTRPTLGGKIATVGDLEQHHFRRQGGADPLKDSTIGTGSRADLSTTLPPTTTMSPVSPVSSATTGAGGALVQMPPMPQSDVSSLSSDQPAAAKQRLFSPLIPPPGGRQQEVQMPSSPLGDSYLSDEGPASPPPPQGQRKYHTMPASTSGPPRVPLPMPPPPAPASITQATQSTSSSRQHRQHRRVPSDASTQPDAIIRIPLHRESDTINIGAGELVRNNLAPGETPQVSVQVKVDRNAKSVTVRRIPEEEVRMQRARERAVRAGEREREIEASMADSEATSLLAPAVPPATRKRDPYPPVTPIRQGKQPLQQRADPDSDSEIDDDGPLPPPSSVGGSRVGGNGGNGGGRESVVSAGGQTDAEAEERIRERRRQKRREERKEGGLAGGVEGGGTYYGDGSGSIGRNHEWT